MFAELIDFSLLLSMILIPICLIATVFTAKLLTKIAHAYQELAMIIGMAPDGIIYSDQQGRILRVNQTTIKIFGYSEAEMKTLCIEDLMPKEKRENHKTYRARFTTSEQARDMANRDSDILAQKKDGTLFHVKISLASKVIEGEMKVVCIIKDVTHLDELNECANTDYLTGLHNRRYFDDTLHKELMRSARKNAALSMLLIDLDHFKELNDHEGHSVGDIALKELSEFLRDNTREYDHLARWGGDEFILLCPHLSTEASIDYAERIRTGFKLLKFPWKKELTLSIGIATAEGTTRYSTSEIIQAADKAVYAAKRSGKDKVVHIHNM